MTDRAPAAPARRLVALPAPRVHRRRLAHWSIALTALGCALGATLLAKPRPWLVWNVSASAPPGLYAVGSAGRIGPGEMVIARPPQGWRAFAAGRRYLPANVPLVKRVAAVPGNRVCARGRWLWIEGARIAERREADRAGRLMPRWSGCITLGSGAHLLLMDSTNSFDGRYFGPTQRSDIIGNAYLLWHI